MIKKSNSPSTGFQKNGQIKVSQNPNKGLKKLADENDKEYGVDDLVKDSDKEEEDGDSKRDE